MDYFAKAKEAFFNNQNQQTYDDLVNAFRALVKNKEWVRFPVEDSSGNQIHANVEKDGKTYMVMFSSDEKVKLARGMSLVLTDINKGIWTVFDNPHCGGMVVDPFTADSLYLTLPQLEYFSGVPNHRTHPVDWGEGIPNYNENDLMVEEELLDFGIQIVENAIEAEGFEILETTNALSQPANIVARKGNEIRAIVVKTEVVDIKTSLDGFNKMPTLTADEKNAAIAFANKFHMIPYFAPVSIGSADTERMIKGLALYGDTFLPKYTGMEII